MHKSVYLLIFLLIVFIPFNLSAEKYRLPKLGISFDIQDNWTKIPANYLRQKASYRELLNFYHENSMFPDSVFEKILIDYEHSILISAFRIELKDVSYENIFIDPQTYQQKIEENIKDDHVMIDVKQDSIPHPQLLMEGLTTRMSFKDSDFKGLMMVLKVPLVEKNECVVIKVLCELYTEEVDQMIRDLLVTFKYFTPEDVSRSLIYDHYEMKQLPGNFNFKENTAMGWQTFYQKDQFEINVYACINPAHEDWLKDRFNDYKKENQDDQYKNKIKMFTQDDVFYIIDFNCKPVLFHKIWKVFFKSFIPRKNAVILNKKYRDLVNTILSSQSSTTVFSSFFQGADKKTFKLSREDYYKMDQYEVIKMFSAGSYGKSNIHTVSGYLILDSHHQGIFYTHLSYRNFKSPLIINETSFNLYFGSHYFYKETEDPFVLKPTILEEKVELDASHFLESLQLLAADFMKNGYQQHEYQYVPYKNVVELVETVNEQTLLRIYTVFNGEELSKKSFRELIVDPKGNILKYYNAYEMDQEKKIRNVQTKISENEYKKLYDSFFKKMYSDLNEN